MAILKEKYKFLFVLLLLFIFKPVQAQKEYNSWVFYNQCSFVFNNNNLAVNTIPNPVGDWQASICDKHTGQLIFYSDGETAYDRSGNLMPNGNLLKGCEDASQGALIVPDPADDSSYYLFTNDCSGLGGTNGLNYNIVNMRLNGGLGDIEKKNVYVCNNLSEKVTAIRACSFDGFWIITYVDTLNEFFAWQLTTSGLQIKSPVISPSNFVGYQSTYDDIGCIKSSPDGNLLIAGFNQRSDSCDYLYDFDKNTGALTFRTRIAWSNAYHPAQQYDFGESFSPDDSKLYFTNIDGTGSFLMSIFQYDLNTGISTQLNQNNVDMGVTGMQLGPDGRLYIANANYEYVAVVNQPDSAGLACNFVLNGVSVEPNKLIWWLSNNIDALYYPDTLFTPNFTYTVNCADSAATFTDNSNITPYEWWWSFGDAASGSNNHSTLQNPIHYYTQPGTYTVTMNAYEGCAAIDSITKTVTVSPCVYPLIIPSLIYGGGSQTKWHIINLPQGANSVILYDELGRVIYKSLNYPNDYDMHNLPPAMYFYRLTLESGQQYVGKIILVK